MDFLLESLRGREIGRPRCRWVDKLQMDIWEIVYKGVNWIHLARDRDRWTNLVYTVRNFRIP
jgi:hypothetical protein